MSVMKFREPNRVLWRGVRPGHNGEQIIKSEGTSGVGEVIIHTVNDGVSLFLEAWSHSAESTAASRSYLNVRDTGDNDLYALNAIHLNGAGHGENSLHHSPPIEIPTGYDIFVNSDNAGMAAYGFIHGWEE